MKIQACLAFTALSFALTGASAAAATFSYEVTNPDLFKDNAGKITQLSTQFDDETQKFSWSSTFSRNTVKNTLAEGAWLVVNNGPNPRKDIKEQAIFYLDGEKEVVSAYAYKGAGEGHSWVDSEFFGTQALKVSDDGDERTLSFDWDVSSINAMTDTFGDQWKGVAFDESIGIWFHGLDEMTAEYDADSGKLSDFAFTPRFRTVYDIEDGDTIVMDDDNKESVPEPGMVMALSGMAVAAAFTKRRKASA